MTDKKTPSITKGFVLAAGKGERMRPLTNDTPKPLLAVDGVPMLDRALDALAAAGVNQVVVNAWYLGEKIETHLKDRKHPKIIISHEDRLLDTGGGVKNALAHFGDEPFFVLNGDVVWFDGMKPALQEMMKAWDPEKMDVLILTCPVAMVNDPALKGDYARDADGRLTHKVRVPTQETAPALEVFAGPRIVHPRVFENTPDGAFSFMEIFTAAEKQGRLFGVSMANDGAFYHVGTPEMLAATNADLSEKRAKKASGQPKR